MQPELRWGVSRGVYPDDMSFRPSFIELTSVCDPNVTNGWQVRPQVMTMSQRPVPINMPAVPANIWRLIPSLHDVSPKFADEVDRLLDLVVSAIGGPSCAMLVVPDHWGDAPLVPGSAFARRLRRWADEGVEMILHGWSHRDDSRHRGAADRWRARAMTAGEAEFLGLGRHEASRRLGEGRALLEDVLGRPVAAFVAPAWLYGPGARAALADCGFEVAEDHMRVWNPATGRVLGRGPVISWASRSRARIASSLAFAGVAPMLLARQKLVRIALHPGDVCVPALTRSIDRTLRHFARDREVVRYADLR